MACELPSTPAGLSSLARSAVCASLETQAEQVEAARRKATRALGVGVGVGAAGGVVAFALVVDVHGALAPVVLLALRIGRTGALFG